MDRAIVKKKKKHAKLKTCEGSTQQEREMTKSVFDLGGERGITNAKMQSEMRRLAAARPASAVRKESGSISSQNVTRRRDDDDTCESKIENKKKAGRGADLSRCQSKDLSINTSEGSRGNRRHSSSTSRGAKERP